MSGREESDREPQRRLSVAKPVAFSLVPFSLALGLV